MLFLLRNFVYICVIILFLACEEAFCKTPVHNFKGVQSDLILKLDDPKKTYQLEGEYKVPEGKQLEISPGITILCLPESQISVSGVSLIAGTEKQPVVFKAAQRGKGPWNGIHFEASLKDSKLEYVNISDATEAIAMTKSSPMITNCIITNNYTGVHIGSYGSGSNPTIDKCIISFNFKDGIFISGSSAKITSCTITKNGGWGINGEYYASPTVSKSIIKLNNNGGIYCRYYECKVLINNSIIFDNGGLDIKNESPLEWDLRSNYWGAATNLLQARNGVASLPNISGKVRMDEFLKILPKECGAGPMVLGGQKLW